MLPVLPGDGRSGCVQPSKLRFPDVLLEKGADVDVIVNNWSPIATAASGGHEGVVRLLINKGANVNTPAGQYGTALVSASYRGYENLVQLLIDNGADLDAQDGEYGTALMVALWSGRKKIVQLLLENGVDANLQDKKYGSALLAAFDSGDRAIVQLLVKHGANVDWSTMRGESAGAEQSPRDRRR
ncbi:ankyrin repeat-containing domain protein [Mycena galopus ATCC 62051]|nr:ankyrin repeat-containing domain protein [Mycena galopus ATCC 62051]